MVGSELARPATPLNGQSRPSWVETQQSRGKQMLLQHVLASRQVVGEKNPQLNGTSAPPQEPW